MSPPLLRPRAKGPSAFATLIYASSTLFSTGAAAAADSFDVLDYVDPFIGTANGGMRYKEWKRTPKLDVNTWQGTSSLAQHCHLVSKIGLRDCGKD